ncbi:MAG: hypothetical protein V1897_12545 [Pseudomonadota bacterium]
MVVELRNIKNQFITLGSSNEKRIEYIQIYIGKAKELFEPISRFISSADRPTWLRELGPILDKKPDGQNPSLDTAFFEKVSQIIQVVGEFQWQKSGIVSLDEIDFNEIYQHCLKESTIPSLFEDVEKILSKIIESKQVDSVRILKSTENLIGTIKKNYKRDYFSVYCTKNLVWSFAKNLLVEELRNLPLLRPLITALEKTLNEIEDGWKTMHSNVLNEINERTKNATPALTYLQNGSLLSFSPKNVTDVKG